MNQDLGFLDSIKNLKSVTRNNLEKRKCCHYMTESPKHYDIFSKRNHNSNCEVINLNINLNCVEKAHLRQRADNLETAKSIIIANLLSFLCVAPLTILMAFLIPGIIAHIIIFGVASILYALVFMLHLNNTFQSSFCERILELKEEIESLEAHKSALLETTENLTETALTKV